MNPTLLIAGREFRAYVATASFWVALLVGPALAIGAMALSQSRPHTPAPASLTLALAQGGGLEARFSPQFPASEATRTQLLGVIAADGQVKGPLRLAAPAAATASDPRAVSRFTLTLALWTTLTGSLGMLLQAVVRIGARARDNADAQNLARPMFAALLAVFFAALAAAGGAQGLDKLVFVPPFTPFMLLMRPPGALAATLAIGLLIAATALAGWLAVASVRLDVGGPGLGAVLRRNRKS